MELWRPQNYQATAPPGYDHGLIDNAVAVARVTRTANSDLPPIFTLKHLAHYSQTDYLVLRSIVTRQALDPYRHFKIRKRSGNIAAERFRLICIPNPTLMTVQRWINQEVLRHTHAHEASTAFGPNCSIKRVVERHCSAQWLIKLDIVSFFESISEIRVYRVFLNLGYQPLVAFELARLCTRLGNQTPRRTRPQWIASHEATAIRSYNNGRLGHLPQGSPTSPVLANLIMATFDNEVAILAQGVGLEYSRYADDITLSSYKSDFNRNRAISIIGKIYSLMGKHGLSPNFSKTKIVPPGSRKVALGLLVDSTQPRLTRRFRHNLRRHLHFLSRTDVGPGLHAQARGFSSVTGLKNHVWGLIAFAHDIDPAFAAKYAEQFRKVLWPL